MNEQNTSSLEPFDITAYCSSFVRTSLRMWWLYFLGIGLGVLLTVALLMRGYTPNYRAEAVFSATYTTGSYDAVFDTYTSSTSSQNAQQLINTFDTILSTDAMRKTVQDKLGKSYINGSISSSVLANSNIFTITVNSSSAQDAYDILQAVIESYPEIAAQVVGNTSLEMLDEPVLPTVPTNLPRWKRTALKCVLLCFALAMGLVALLSFNQVTLRSPKDIQKVSNMTCLAVLPRVRRKRRTAAAGALSIRADSMPMGYQEGIRTLRSRLLRRLKDKGEGCKVILITSTVPHEGKSTVASNLALSLSNTGKQVILVDADLRVQNAFEFFQLEGTTIGLPELLRDDRYSAINCLRPVANSSLRVLCGSNVVDKPAPLLRAERIARVMNSLRKNADYIIVDTPPIGLLSDASAFLPSADGLVYVLHEDAVSRSQLTAALQPLADYHNLLLGYVYNGASSASTQYGYGRRRSGYGYGYGYGKKGGYGDYASAKEKESAPLQDDTASEPEPAPAPPAPTPAQPSAEQPITAQPAEAPAVSRKIHRKPVEAPPPPCEKKPTPNGSFTETTLEYDLN